MTPSAWLAYLMGIDTLAQYRDDAKLAFSARDTIERLIADKVATGTVDHWLSLLASSVACAERTGVEIAWEKRSLQDFEGFPVEELARVYDLIVIDHPHVGQISRENCLAPLDLPGRDAEPAPLAAGSVGVRSKSYAW